MSAIWTGPKIWNLYWSQTYRKDIKPYIHLLLPVFWVLQRKEKKYIKEMHVMSRRENRGGQHLPGGV